MEEQISSISRVLTRLRDAAQEALLERHPTPRERAPTTPARASRAAPDNAPQGLAHPVWLTVEEGVRYLGLKSRMALYQAVRRGQVPAHRIGRRMRFRRSELDEALGAR